jgi:two-component system capsular synthesis sensor histidine kinase RcsC
VHNASLHDFVSLLSNSGMRVSRYEGQTPDADDMLVTDDEQAWREGRSRSAVVISASRLSARRGMDTASPRRMKFWGCWHVFTVSSWKTAKALRLPSPESLASENDDMMILVVDDHPINRRLLADQLGSLGYQCKTANDGVDALNVLSKNHIDIVLSDVNMPNMDGYRLTQRIRQLGLTLPVVG